MNSIMGFITSWGPLLLVIGVWIFLSRKSNAFEQEPQFEEIKQYLVEHLAETKLLNTNLNRIATALENKSAAVDKNTERVRPYI